MRIIIEEYKYAAADVKDVLKGIDALENVEGYVSVNYVGYFYNTDESVRDCVFILPKVLLEVGDDKEELVFGKYRPEDIINLDAHNPLTQQEKDFIYEFAVWIYRSIVVFHNDKRNQTSIVYHKKIAEVGKGGRHLSNTFLDILLSLVQFNKENQNFFFFVLRNLHAGFNKINWTRTIATTDAIVQGKDAIYLRPVNKKRQINFDEELLVIFFSILNYISEHYGFPVTINCNFQLITGKQFKTYLNGMGKVRLRQIKYKYFSDKALQLWDLCYAFFDTARQVYVSTEQKEYLLVKNFNIVFLGDSIMNDTWCGGLNALLSAEYPDTVFHSYLSVRGSTGCWYYHEPAHFEEYVARYKPNFVVIGGISNYREGRMSVQEAEDCVVETIGRCKAIGAEVAVCSPAKSREFRASAEPAPFAANGDVPWLRSDYLRRAAERTGVQFWDMTTGPCGAVAGSGRPLGWFNRDEVHSDDRGKALNGMMLYLYFNAAQK